MSVSILKKIIIGFLSIFLFITNFKTMTVFANTKPFSDVEKSRWSYDYINKINELGITDGIGNNLFGPLKSLTRAEFITFMCRLLDLDTTIVTTDNYEDNQNQNTWYYNNVKIALKHGIINTDQKKFRPTELITREEIAVMIARSLGYDDLSQQLSSFPKPFLDVNSNIGYITLCKDLSIIDGIGNGNFEPLSTATREQAAAMLVRMYHLLNINTDFVNGFYAINSSSQTNLIKDFDSISFGWSKLEIDSTNNLYLNTTSKNNNEYYIPSGYEQPYLLADSKTKMLLVSVNDKDSSKIINDDNYRNSAADIISKNIVNGLNKNDENISFDGVVIDFETLKGETSKNNFNDFLRLLKFQMPDKKIFVAVHPKLYDREYFDGYDYKTIGDIADKVILMAHDYNTKKLTASDMENGIVMTPITPIADVYYALKCITDSEYGVSDKSKIVLQISFNTVQWKTKDGKVINESPYTPNYEILINRIKKSVDMNYSSKYQNPYIVFHNKEDDTQNIVWYEDKRSVDVKIKLSNLFNIKGISFWRLGNIPSDSTLPYLDILG